MTNKIKGNLLSMQCPKSLVAKKNIELELFASHRAVRHEKWNISRNERKHYASRPHEVCALPTRIGSVAYARNHAGIHAEKESFKKIENTRRSTTRCVYCTKHVNRNRGRCSHTRLYVSDTLHKSLEWLKWS